MARYLKFIIIEEGMGGFFTHRSPRDIIEGYTDDFLMELYSKPVYESGDQTNDPSLAMNRPKTLQSNTSIALFTGEDDYLYTRKFALWNGREFMTVKKRDYQSINKLIDVYYKPWNDTHYVRILC